MCEGFDNEPDFDADFDLEWLDRGVRGIDAPAKP
jgi:hypothetical protein